MPIELLTPEQTAALLGLSPGTLMVWRSNRRYPLAFVKVGGRVRYRKQDVEKFIERRTVDPAAPTLRRRRCNATQKASTR